MYKKLVGILVCMLLIVTALSATGATNVYTLGYLIEKNELAPYLSTPMNSPGNIAIMIIGKVTDVDDQFNLLGGAIQVGDYVLGKYIYDSATLDSDTDPRIGIYEHTSAPYGLELETGGIVFETNPNAVMFGIAIYDDYYNFGDLYAISSLNNLDLSNGIRVTRIMWELRDSTGNALSGDALPTTAPVLSDWEENELSIIGNDPSDPDHTYAIYALVTLTALNRSKTRDIYLTTQPILFWFLDRFPNAFPILRQLLGLI